MLSPGERDNGSVEGASSGFTHHFPPQKFFEAAKRPGFFFQTPTTPSSLVRLDPLQAVDGGLTSQWPTETRPARRRRAPPPLSSEGGLGPAGLRGPGSWGHLLAPHEEELVPAFGPRSKAVNSGVRTTRPGVARSSQMPLSLPAELELNHRSALLEPCAASAAAAATARARNAAPD